MLSICVDTSAFQEGEATARGGGVSLFALFLGSSSGTEHLMAFQIIPDSEGRSWGGALSSLLLDTPRGK